MALNIDDMQHLAVTEINEGVWVQPFYTGGGVYLYVANPDDDTVACTPLSSEEVDRLRSVLYEKTYYPNGR
jgi:hypothetical protein